MQHCFKKKQGMEKAMEKIIKNGMQKGYSAEKLAELTDLTIEEVDEIVKKL